MSDIVGRDDELEALSSFLGATAEGPIALLLEGEPGIGKTTLWKEAVADARERSFHVLACRPGGAEVQLSFAALGDLLEEVLVAALPELPTPRRRALEVALLLEEARGRPPDQRAVGLAFLDVLRLLARSSPVLLAVDDLQWLDRPSAIALEFALRRLEGEAVAILAALRVEEARGIRLDLERALPEGRLQRLRLEPLSPGALHRLLRSRLGTVFPRPTLRHLYEASGGNPFYALEIARALDRRGEQPAIGEPLPIPEDLSDLVRARLEGLAPAALKVVKIVAALANPTLAVVTTAAPASDQEAIEEAVAAGVIELEGDRLRFSHPLLGSATYSALAPLEQRGLHRHLAAVVTDIEQRARHLALSAEAPEPDVADVLDEAAKHASSRGAPDAAAELAEQSLRLTSPERPEDLHRRRLALADHHFTAGNIPRARTLLEEALADSPPGRERAEVLGQLATVRGESDSARVGVDLCRAALKEAEGDARLEANLNLTLAFVTSLSENLHIADAHARAAVEHAQEVADPSLLAACLAAEGLIDFCLGRGVQLEKMERALALERSSEHVWTDVRPSTLFGFQLKWVGDLARSRVLLERVRDLAGKEEDASLSTALYYLAFLELLAEDWQRAARYADEAYEVAEQSGRDLTNIAGAQAVVAAHLGFAESARRHAGEGITRGEGGFAQLSNWALGHLEVSLGNLPAARPHLKRATASYRALANEEPAMFFWFPLEVETLIGLGELDEAEALLDWVEERALRLDRAWALATGYRGRGLVAAARGDLAEAFAAFERALAEHERVPQRFELACTLLALGSTQRRAKKKRPARESLQSALAIFQNLGARLWAEKARAELARIGGRALASGGLTPTEQRVAALVAEGRSNREVAATLIVAPRTVEWNLTKIYAKLGVHSRAELAYRLGREGSSPADSSAGQ
jgi:DNA-binding CsgD family transcriptional regulator